jgi:hypothetical protein
MASPFDMPDLSAGFPKRGAWVVRRLGTAFALNDIQAAGIVGNLGYESDRLYEIAGDQPAHSRLKRGPGLAHVDGDELAPRCL